MSRWRDGDVFLNGDDRLLTVDDLSAFLQVPACTIYQWRYRRKGPRAVKAGTLVRYRMKDVLEWLEERTS